MAKHKHLTLQERYEIQHGLDSRESFKQIGLNIGKDTSTISKEVKGHYTVVESGGNGRAYNPCAYRRACVHNSLCDYDRCTHHKCPGYCKDCFRHCSQFKEEVCPRLSKPPMCVTDALTVLPARFANIFTEPCPPKRSTRPYEAKTVRVLR